MPWGRGGGVEGGEGEEEVGIDTQGEQPTREERRLEENST